MIIKTLLIDDEDSAREVLRNMLSQPALQVQILAEVESVAEAVAAIQKEKPDLIFLDIEMPYQSGFELFNKINLQNTNVIFTTAYSQYAIKAIKYSALDYLLKPISPLELKAAIDKARKKNLANDANIASQLEILKSHLVNDASPRLVVPVANGLEIIQKNEIIYLEGDRNYTWIHSKNRDKILTTKTLGEYESLLTENHFFRIYQSYLVNMNHAIKYINGRGGNLLMSDGANLMVSREKKKELLARLV